MRHDAERRRLEVELGDLTSGQELDVVLKVRFPRKEIGETAGLLVELHSAGEPLSDAASECRWTYSSHLDNDAQPRDRVVDRAVAQLCAARARAEATEANRHHHYDRAQQVLEATAARIREYAGDDRDLQQLASALSADVTPYGGGGCIPADVDHRCTGIERIRGDLGQHRLLDAILG